MEIFIVLFPCCVEVGFFFNIEERWSLTWYFKQPFLGFSTWKLPYFEATRCLRKIPWNHLGEPVSFVEDDPIQSAKACHVCLLVLVQRFKHLKARFVVWKDVAVAYKYTRDEYWLVVWNMFYFSIYLE